MVSSTASLVERAKPEEKAILVRIVSTEEEGSESGEGFVPRMMVSPRMEEVSRVESSR